MWIRVCFCLQIMLAFWGSLLPCQPDGIPAQTWQWGERTGWVAADVRQLRTGTKDYCQGVVTAMGEGREGGLFVASSFVPVPGDEAEKHHEYGLAAADVQLNGLWRLKGETWEYPYPYLLPAAPRVNCLAADERGWIWAGTDEGLVVLANGEAWVNEGFLVWFKPFPYLTRPHYYQLGLVQAIVFPGDSTVWLSGDWPALCGGLPEHLTARRPLEMESHQYYTYPPREERIRMMARNAGSEIWALTDKGGLVRWGKQTFYEGDEAYERFVWVKVSQLIEEFPPSAVRFLRLDRAGRLWVVAATESGDRLAFYDVPRDAWTRCGQSDALVGHSTISEIAEDRPGRLYFASSHNGLFVLDGENWKPHPVNEFLPHIPPAQISEKASEARKERLTPWTHGVNVPTSTLFCDQADNLWIGSSIYLVKWSGGPDWSE